MAETAFTENPREMEYDTPEIEPLPSGDCVTFCERGNTEGWIKVRESCLTEAER